MEWASTMLVPHLLQDPESPFKEFKTIGLSITCAADKLITDSAAGATAIATGYLTNNKYISVDPKGNPLYTIFEHAEKLGLSTGIVVTSNCSACNSRCICCAHK